jgi:cyclase
VNTKTDLDPLNWAKEVERRGAGEIYLTSVDRDGAKNGFDLELINYVAGGVEIPVIASGGAGHPGHILEVFKATKASAVSAANMFHFSEHSVIVTKAFLKMNAVDIRLNTHANYASSSLNDDFRVQKLSEGHLQNLVYERIEKEVI